MDIKPMILTGCVVRLEPLSEAHIPDLCTVGLEAEIWRFMRYGQIKTAEEMRTWVLELLELQQRGTDLPWAVIHLKNGRAVGSTRYMHIDHEDRSLEIGGTWYGLDYQRTAVNTECKYMLIKHAFERLGCVRVWFKADGRNQASQRAIERLGAVKEGVLRNHMILQDGFIRDSVVYSILPSEWPRVKAELGKKLNL